MKIVSTKPVSYTHLAAVFLYRIGANAFLKRNWEEIPLRCNCAKACLLYTSTPPVNEQDKTKPKGKLERFNAKLRAWEAEAPLRAAQAEEHKQRVSELSYKGGANKNKLCPICGYSLVPNSSSSNYCKCQRHTNYGINEGIAGTREANKKMRGRGG